VALTQIVKQELPDPHWGGVAHAVNC